MSDDKHPEIVIIRRGGHGDHDEHHGGVWKIAFADFMTAMMAFFLVMWLISANDKTRASVARYFNPVRLVDATTQPRGLHDSKKDESGITATPEDAKATDAKQGKPDSTSKELESKTAPDKAKPEKASLTKPSPTKPVRETAAARETRLDAALRENPYVALAEIVATKPPSEGPARRGADAFRDPFAPPPPAAEGASDVVTVPSEADAREAATNTTRTEPAAGGETTQAAEAAKKAAKEAVAKTATEKAAEGDAEAVRAALQAGGPQVAVRRTNEGLLVSFTDTESFAMFANGSAVPSRRLVLLMERTAKLVAARHGAVVVRGYTDNRPYRAGRYDNWHLSLDRAQVTHYMLVRGGLEDARIGHVEGYADRAPTGRDASNPSSRRIEILLQDRT